MNKLNVFFGIAIAMVLVGCGSDGGDGSTGQMQVSVTDAPVDEAAKVVVQFTGLEIKPQGGSAFQVDFAAPKTIDLLALNGGGSRILMDTTVVPAGAYEFIRLKVNAQADSVMDSFIELKDGSQHELRVPSGDQTGLKLVSGFTVAAGGTTNFTIDFDLRKAVHQTGSPTNPIYMLRPALRIVDNNAVGTILGTVSNSLAAAPACTPVVYVFSGAGTTPDDIDDQAAEPLTTTFVKLNTNTGIWEYRAAFLPVGAYTVSFTCSGSSDNPDASDTLIFQGTQNATVAAGQFTSVNFAP